ncbi:MAG: HEAT repeat domain-containing protein, partial [Anaerolineae bacterium]|nr:HEAT repeat domain-containing protein [Anaerolineae bacterium]
MSELDAFENEIRKKIKLLAADDAGVRRKAAVWLGEAGDPSAITRLRQVYKEDPDRQVRAAAEYSLGMFRALEQGLDGDDSEAVMKRLEDIAVRGQMGRRVRFRASSLRKISLGLLVSLAMLLAFNFVVWPQLEPRLGGLLPSSGGGDRASLLRDVDAYVNQLSADAATLQRQYQNVLGGGAVDCSV